MPRASCRANGKLIEHIRCERGLTQDELVSQAGVSRRNYTRVVIRGQATSLSFLSNLAWVLGVDAEELLAGRRRAASQRDDDEWDLSANERHACSQWITAPNALRFRVYKLESRFIQNKFARAKRYDLARLPQRIQVTARDHLVRHPQVCHLARSSRHVATNYLSSRRGDSWWVLDEWVEGTTLEIYAKKPQARRALHKIMHQIALGLDALRKSRVVARELSPKTVQIRAGNERVVLTDFELGKLLDGAPTVSPQNWPRNPYRAPEVTGANPDVDERADLYSWAAILVFLLKGDDPTSVADSMEVLKTATLPPAVSSIAMKCLAIPSEREHSIKSVLRATKAWH